MRRILLLTIALLVTISPFLLRPAQTQEPDKPLPNPADYPEAGKNCKRKVKLTPHVSTPDSGCVLDIHTCKGVVTTSAARTPRTGYCDDFWAAHAALGQREICCDPGSPEEKRPTHPASAKKCEKPTPWFGSSSNCSEVQTPVIAINAGAVTLSICGYPVFRGVPRDKDPLYVDAYKAAMRDHVQGRVGSKICCDKLREAARTGTPCYPGYDVDCDGKPNQTDVDSANPDFPDINNLFSRSEGAPIDLFPFGLDPDDPNFLPPPEKCDCKWELVKGSLNCSRDGKQPHFYQARWRCPSTGNERFTRKEAAATAPCS